MENLKKISFKIFSFLIIGLLIYFNISTIVAGSFSVSQSTSTVSPGGTFTVTVNISGSGMIYFSGSNASVSESSTYCDGSCSITATAHSVGTASVTVTTGEKDTENEVADYADNRPIEGSKTVTVNVIDFNTSQGGNSNGGNSGNSTQTQTPQTPEKEEDPKSSDSSLASLSIKEGKLSPEFKAGTTSYKVSLAEGTTSVNVSAKANDAKASVSGTGEVKVKAGSNKVSLTVTAEDGSTTVYTITADVKEKAVTTMELNGKSLNVYQNPQGASLDNNAFEKTTVKINDSEVPAWKSEAQKLTLLYLDGEDGNDFYIYDEASKKVTSIYRPVGILGKNIVMIDVPENLQKRDGMKFTSVEIDKVTFPGWTFEDSAFENYALIYVMDGQGKHVYYQYDKSENTLQLFSGAAAITQEKYEDYVKEKEDKEQTLMYVIYGLTAGCVVLLGLAGFFFIRRKPSVPKHRKVDIEKEDYENRFHIEKED